MKKKMTKKSNSRKQKHARLNTILNNCGNPQKQRLKK